MSPSIWQILIVVLLIAVFFGRGRISAVMEDIGKGIKSFKQGMKDEENEKPRISESQKDKES